MPGMWQAFLDTLGGLLVGLHAALDPLVGVYAWGLSIVALTVLVRVVLVPLGVVQGRTLRRRLALAPQVDAAKRGFDTSDRLRRRDPDRFMANVGKQRAAVKRVYREHGVRPATSLMIMVAQSPVLFGLYRLLASPETLPVLQAAPFVLIEQLSLSVLAGAGVGAVVLVAVVAATTWLGHRQVARVTPHQPGQPSPGVLGAVMTGMIATVATTLPAGVLLYWATTGLWTVGQQALLLR